MLLLDRPRMMTSDKDNTLDESRIRSLLIKERYYRDAHMWQKMRDCYHPDASKTRVYIQWHDGDIDSFIEGTQRVTEEKITTIHAINPVDIDIRGSKALVVSFCTMTSRFEYKGFEYDKVSIVRLINRLGKLDASQESVWKILALEGIYIRDSMIPVVPPPADSIPDFEGAEKFSKGYRYSAWLLSYIGVKSRPDMAEEDNRESVSEVFCRNNAWLEAA